MALLEANLGGGWFALPTPSPENYSPTYTHLEKSFTTSNGYLHRDIIRRNRAKVTCGWNALTADEMALLQSLYDATSFQLRFTDNKKQRVEKKVYAGPLDGKTKRLDKDTLLMTLRTSVTMNFIEF